MSHRDDLTAVVPPSHIWLPMSFIAISMQLPLGHNLLARSGEVTHRSGCWGFTIVFGESIFLLSFYFLPFHLGLEVCYALGIGTFSQSHVIRVGFTIGSANKIGVSNATDEYDLLKSVL